MNFAGSLTVTGLGCRLPGANSVSEFSQLLSDGRTSISELPSHRLDRASYLGKAGDRGKTYCTIGGVVPDLEHDPALAAVDPELLADYDQPYRHLLAAALEALRSAGCDPALLKTRKTGLFVGHARGSLQAAKLACATWVEDTVARLDKVDAWRAIPEAVRDHIAQQVIASVRMQSPRRKRGGGPFITPSAGIGLTARVLGCQGPVVAVDAACASSFQALALAGRAIRSGDCDLAFVGGASYNNLHSLILFSQAQALATAGSFPFDSRAEGFVGSDGYAVILVARPEVAAELGLPVHAVVRSVGESCDGRGKSLWAPRREGQLLAMQRAWTGDLDRGSVGYIEAHATSTAVGDVTELEALSEFFRGARAPIPIGSVKANIGHTREAAGLSSLIKVIVSMREGVVPHSPYLQELQPDFDWANAPVFVPRSRSEWPTHDGIRRACVNSFGIGGLNVHLVVDDQIPPDHRRFVAGASTDTAVAITGRGCVLPSAFVVGAFERLLQSGLSAVGPVPEERWNAELYCAPNGDPAWHTQTSRGGFVRNYTFDWQAFKTPPRQLEHADPLHFWVLGAARQALEEAGYSKLDRSRIAVVAGTIFGGDFVNQLSRCLHLPEFEQTLRERCAAAGIDSEGILTSFREQFLRDIPVLDDDSGGFTASTLASRVARTFDLMGGAFAIDCGESSSEAALRSAQGMLNDGTLDAVLVIGAQRMMDMTCYIALASRNQTAVPGEGVAAVVLRRTADAERDGSRVRGAFSGTVQPGIAPQLLGHTLGASGMVSLLESTVRREKPRVAFLFGGQGAQYAGMLRELVAHEPAARRAMERCDAALALSGQPGFAELAWSESAETLLGQDVLRTQLAVLCADLILLEALESRGVRADAVAGYSYGDYAALVACGSVTLQEAVAITVERCRCIANAASDDLLVAVPLARAEAEQAARAHGSAWTAIDNGDSQTIIGAQAGTARRIAAGCGGRIVNVPRAFHTPLLADAAEEFGRYLNGVRFRPPRTPFYAAVDCRYIADPGEIRDYLVRHLTSTIEYGRSVRALAAERTTLFVEVGPRSILTGLHKRLLGPDSLAFASDGPVTAIRKIAAAASGAPDVLEFDATRLRREANAESSRAPRAAEAQPTTNTEDELTRSLIQFVCEQTGYPVELVDLDADLEADLGIDSIRKAQLMGQMRERYGFAVTGVQQLSLADFPTLRSIRNFIEKNAGGEVVDRRPETPVASRASVAEAPVRQTDLVELHGTPFDIGFRHAQHKKQEIETVLTSYYQLAGAPSLSDNRLQGLVDRSERLLGASGLSELEGIARGLDRSLLELLTYNIALCPDYLPGCSQFVTETAEGMLHGANEDSGLAIHLRGLLKPFPQVRRPAGDIPHLLFTLPGRVGGLNGVNRAGVCVTSALLLDRSIPADDASGLFHPVLVQNILASCETLDDALRVIRTTTRLGAWSMMVSASGQSRYVEYDGDLLHESDAVRGCTNHSLGLGSGRVPEHSTHRLTRLRAQLGDADSRSFEGALRTLRDLFDHGRGRVVAHPTMNTIRRVDNLYSAVFVPARREAWWTNSSGEFEKIDVAEALCTPAAEIPHRCVLRAVEDRGRVAEAVSVNLPESVALWTGGADCEPLIAALRSRGLDVRDSSEHLIVVAPEPGLDAYSRGATELHEYLRARITNIKSITGVTSMGGDYGFGHAAANPFGGAIAGLLKAIRREFPNVPVRVLDFPVDEPAALVAEAVCTVLSSRYNGEIETGFARRTRLRVRAIPEQPRPEASGIEAGDVWVISGGARGITALVAAELHRRYGLKIHVLGTADRKDTAFARYHRCDVSDLPSVVRTMQAIRDESGPIRGVLHGAGVEFSAGFLNKKLADVARTVDVKVGGAVNLLEATKHDPLTHFVAFSSISGRFGGFGQTDYACASELLAKLMHRVRSGRRGVKSVAFHWPAWGDTGMAMRPESKLVLEIAGHEFLPAAKGVQHVIDELEAGCPEPEILIAVGTEPLDTSGTVLRSVPPGRDLVDRFIELGSRRVAETVLDGATHSFLRDHRWRSAPMLPAAAMIALLLQGERDGTVENFQVENALMFGEGPIRVRSAQEADGSALLYTEHRNASGKLMDPARPVASARIRAATALMDELDDIGADFQTIDYADEATAAREDRVYFGESMRTLQEFAAVPGGGLARGVLQTDSTVPLLDACFVACGIYCRRKFGTPVLVHGADKIVITRALDTGAEVRLRLQYRRSVERIHEFDLLLADSDGHGVIRMSGIRMIATGEATVA